VDVSLWAWFALGVLVVVLLLVDLFLFGRSGSEITLRSAVVWSIIWMVLGSAMAVVLWAWQGGTAGEEYFAGFLIEKSLSLDNLFVFAMIFAYFGVPYASQRRVLFWGIVAAVVLRGAFIAGGAALLDSFHAMIYVFGAFLIITGIRMATHSSTEIHPEKNLVLRGLKRVVPLTHTFDGTKFLSREGGRRVATPLMGALVLVAAFDVLFAVDSIPAIFAVTEDTFIVAAANAFSLLGLSALYFTLAGMMQRFKYLNVGLAVVLVLVGAKMLLSDVYEAPAFLAPAVITVVLGITIWISMRRTGSDGAGTPRTPIGETGT
jgi:tellurite resistance protein TerC